MSRRAAAASLVALLVLGFARTGSPCNVTTACNAASFNSCCSGSTCTLDSNITFSPGANCGDFDFGSRNVVLQPKTGQANTGIFNVGANVVTIEAASFRVKGGQLLARGTVSDANGAGTAGGSFTITTSGGGTTCASGLPSFGMDPVSGAPAPLIDVSGGGLVGGGSFQLFASGAICLNSGSVHADGLGTDPFDSPGGLVRMDAVDVPADLSVAGGVVLSTVGGLFTGGLVDLSSPTGAVTLGAGTQLLADGLDGSGPDGGTVSVVGGTISALGIVSAVAGQTNNADFDGGDGGEVTLDARTGALFIQHSGGGISVLGAPGGSGGIVNLFTNALTTTNNEGTLNISAPITAGTTETNDLTGGGGGEVTVLSSGDLLINKTIDMTGRGDDTGEAMLTAVRDVDVNVPLQAQDEGDGAMLTIQSGQDINVNDNVSFGTTPNFSGSGGSVTLTAGRNIVVKGDVDASGALDGDGGSITMTAVHNLTVNSGGGVVSANGGTSGAGGNVALAAGEDGLLLYSGDLTLNGMVMANGAAGTTGPATIDIEGCTITITGAVNSVGGNATNTVTARSGITITNKGTLKTTAGAAPGTNTILYPTGSTPSIANGTVSPATTPTQRPVCTAENTPLDCLPACPLCGSGGQPQFPETCRGNDVHCTACTHCQVSHEDTCDDPMNPNPCIYHSCDPEGGCLNNPIPDGTPCGGNACTGESQCFQGFCASTNPPPSGCVNDPSFPCMPGHPLCDDGDPCTDDSCDPSGNSGDGMCRHDHRAGCCQQPGDCPGATVCTLCTDNVCVNQDNCCTADGDCADANPCTTETCNMNTNTCNAPTNVPAGKVTGCGDDACFPNAQCDGNGACIHDDPGQDMLPCSSADPCVVAFCDSVQGCVMPPTPGCCHPGDRCDDHHACTADSCDAGSNTCVHDNTPGCVECTADVDCDGRNIGLCGTSVCSQGGTCVAITPPNCDDGKLGTIDSCVPDGDTSAHCEHTCIDNGACDDGKFCNGVEVCTDGACLPGTAPSCDDGNLCHINRCDTPTDKCAFDTVSGIPGITCHLDMFARAFANVGPTDVSKGTRKRIGKLLAGARAKLAKAASTKKPKAQAKQLKAAGTQLAALENLVLRQTKVAFDLEKTLAGEINDANMATSSYRTSLI